MGILDLSQIIKGVRPSKNNQPTYNGGRFDKTLPLGPHNTPISKYTKWKIYGYRKDITGMKTPYWLYKTLPTGVEITPKKCGLDGFFDVKACNQIT